MAIQKDATSTIGAAATTTPATWSHTCAGANRWLAVFLEVKASPSPISSVTYNGVSMAKVAGASIVDATNAIALDCWCLSSPAVGTNTISVTWTTGVSERLLGVAISLTGVLGIDNSSTASGTLSGSTPQPSASVTPVPGNCWVLGATGVNDNTALAATTGTLFGQLNDGTTPFHTLAGAFISQISPGVSTAVSFNNAVSTDSWVMGAVAFAPVSNYRFNNSGLRPHVFSPGLAR